MKYFFVLGSNPTLSIAEICRYFDIKNNINGKVKIEITNNANILLMESDKDIDSKSLIKKLGGTIKIGAINNIAKNNNDLLPRCLEILDPKDGKYKYGISFYGKRKLNIKPLGMEIKKYLKNKNISCRWVISRETVLSSVVIEQNKLTEKGIEIVLIENGDEILIGKTFAVQPFKELSYRDYSRPAKDSYSGMLPPKLAQIMINLAGNVLQNDKKLLDPFCGSGTVLTEAMLIGYNNLIGADISEKAIADTKTNFEWTKNKFRNSLSERKNISLNLIHLDVKHLSKKMDKNSIDVVVTEPYLGPQRGKVDVIKIKKELEFLFSRAIEEFEKIVKQDGVIIMIWPVFQERKKIYSHSFENVINPKIGKFAISNPIPSFLLQNKNIKTTNRNTIIYGREGQKVWREIVILKYTK